MSSGFAFISNSLDVRCKLPIVINQNIQIDKATEFQTAVLRNELNRKAYYEQKAIKQENMAGSKSYTFQDLEPSDFRYFVINYNSDGFEILNFLQVSNLVYPHLVSFYDYSTDKPFGQGNIVGWSRNSISSQIYYNDRGGDYAVQILENTHIFELQIIREAFENFDKLKYPSIHRAVRLHYELARVDNLTHLRTLGRFAVIEMLLTHKPRSQDKEESITNQIIRNTLDASNQFSFDYKYDLFRPNQTHKKIWTALYEFRSRITHGEFIDFADRDLKVLSDFDLANEFLLDATRSLLKYAVLNPQSYMDLKSR